MPVDKAKLQELNRRWKEQRAKAKETGSGRRFPDGRYLGRLTNMTMDIGDDVTAVMEFTFLDGDHTGQTHKKFHNNLIQSDRGMEFLGADLMKFGYDPDEIADFSQIEKIAKELTKRKPGVRLQLKTNTSRTTGNDFQATYINAVLTDEELEDLIEDGGSDDDEEPASGASEDDNSEEEDSDEEESEDEEPEASVGMRVRFEWKGEKKEGTITALYEEEEKAQVTDDNGKKYKVSGERLSLIAADAADEEDDEEDEEEEEETPAPVKRGPGRPKKTETASATTAATPKRGPGRPRKNP